MLYSHIWALPDNELFKSRWPQAAGCLQGRGLLNYQYPSTLMSHLKQHSEVNFTLSPPGSGRENGKETAHATLALPSWVLTSGVLDLAYTRRERWPLHFQEFCELNFNHSHYLKSKLYKFTIKQIIEKQRQWLLKTHHVLTILLTINHLCSWGYLHLLYQQRENALEGCATVHSFPTPP